MSKFFFCQSPFTILPPGRVGYLYHYDKPRFFAAISTINDNDSFTGINVMGYNTVFQYHRGDGHSQFYVIQVAQNLDRASKKMGAALQSAAGWYSNYLDEEDYLTYGTHSNWSILHDYNVLTPDLQLLHLPSQGKFLISFPDGLKTADTEEAMMTFLIKTLAYPEVVLERGSMNTM